MNSSAQHRPRPPRRRTTAVAVALALASSALTGALTSPAAATPATHTRPDVLQQRLDELVGSAGVPGALAAERDRYGHTRTYTAGVGDLATGSKMPDDGQVRIGSNTKAFTAVVVLQLVGEHRLALDDTIGEHLHSLAFSDGTDAGAVTVGQLLQQTSGLPNYSKYLGDDVRTYQPLELVDLALQHKEDFRPGKWGYSNTNYVLAGLIVEEVTGRSIAAEIDQRVIKRLGLRHTYFPAPGDATIRGPHPHGYIQESPAAPLTPGAPLTDVTGTDPSWAWAAGQLVSTNSDLNTFYTALLKGGLLKKAQLDAMRTTVPTTGGTFPAGTRYGLGLVSTPLSCGGVHWGHGGSFPGYETRGGVTEDGRAVDIAVTVQPNDGAAMQKVEAAVDAALCR
ncbi:beta-lactamase family protein [Kitasatospora sp. NBC_00240]|uniref:serine hydrolase domain-containing protein n=1 Tax=Kitasatospora sp. NBC_00240 TaxID=2903567 RepID=UPI002259A18D|nr:serine hydrolase domain-containing protein [Kitasatospora sp. NBC_00240]MCX5214549.1 beta-lactamase family protein [Kitasatospora sp. NBC_00240]